MLRLVLLLLPYVFCVNQAPTIVGENEDGSLKVAVGSGSEAEVASASAATATSSSEAEAKAEAEPALLLSVCVPCIPRDKNALKTLMENVQAQTRAPHEVVIAISETSEHEGHELQEGLQKTFTKGAVLVVPTGEKMTAGQNRNRAVQAATGDVITFFDADDEMHPQRTELVLEIVGKTENHAQCLVHAYMDDPYRTKKKEFDAKELNWRSAKKAFGKEIYEHQKSNTNGFKELRWYGKVPAHICKEDQDLYACSKNERKNSYWTMPMQGNPTCLKEVMLKVPQTDRPRGQDQEFLNNVLKTYGAHDYVMVLADLPLTLYHPSDHEENHKDGHFNGKDGKQKPQAALIAGGEEMIGGMGVAEEVKAPATGAPSASS